MVYSSSIPRDLGKDMQSKLLKENKLVLATYSENCGTRASSIDLLC
jgi:hypothetical protein